MSGVPLIREIKNRMNQRKGVNEERRAKATSNPRGRAPSRVKTKIRRAFKAPSPNMPNMTSMLIGVLYPARAISKGNNRA
jgi:hypothetical protein